MAELPFQAEYAKSGRAACKGCKEKIDQGVLRIAIMVQSGFHDGKQPNWHHFDCFFKKARATSSSQIGNFNKLKGPDQKKIEASIANYTGVAVDPAPKGKGKAKKGKRASEDATNMAIKDFAVEYSKSSRASCHFCEIKICKDDVRICKIRFDTDVGMKYGGQPCWYHVQCFAKARDELGYMAAGENLPGFNLLKSEDQKIVKDEIKSKSGDSGIPNKKIKTEPKDAEELKAEKNLEKLIEKQNKLYHKHRGALSSLEKSQLDELLRVNGQEIPQGIDERLDRLADCMAFGALKPCPECGGQLVLDNFNYKCTGNISEWSKCRYTTVDPDKKLFSVIAALKTTSAFNKYKPKIDTRAFKPAPPPPVVIKKEEPKPKNIPIPPLKNLQFFIQIRSKETKEDIKRRILKLGGLVVSKLTDTTAAVVSTKQEVEKMSSKMLQIQEADIEVVEESFIDLIDPAKGTLSNSLELIKLNNIASWGSDPTKRIPQDVIDGKSIPKSGSLYVKSDKSKSTKLKIKGGSAVDPDSGLVDEAHVYKSGDRGKHSLYCVVLSKTDVVAQKNSYYKLQLLEADDRNKYWLFRAWGRIGTTIGGKKTEPCSSLHDGIKKFEALYLEKTENYWGDPYFEKIPDCYFPIEMDYGAEDSAPTVLDVKADSRSKLPTPVQELVVRIFDMKMFKQTLLEYELDTEKMPLGKLSKSQIKSGYKVLTQLLNHIHKANQNQIIDATNRFYTLVPHDFGMENAPLLDNEEAIRKKTEMLDSMLEIEIAYSMMKTDDSSTTSPVESCYNKLKTEIAPLPRDSEEFAIIEEYLKNSHGATHHFKLEIEHVFKVVREGEEKRYKPFRKLHNRRLLWHGSRVTNFAGILSQGLRIAPPEAPVTGYMFGKGIYFADMVSKSANYCNTNKQNPTGIMLLCDVALGNMKECTRAEMITQLPAGTHSCWGRGRTQPDPAGLKELPGVAGLQVPLGKPQDVNINTSLLYNEFIVYDVAQVNVKYLLQLKFNHQY